MTEKPAPDVVEAACNMPLRSAVFEVLRRHAVSEQCFAEVAAITQAALQARPDAVLVGELERELDREWPKQTTMEWLWENRHRILSALRTHDDTLDSMAQQIADTPGAGLLSEDDALRELGLLYNYRDDDSRQFTRWQMLVAMCHGYGLAQEATVTHDDTLEDAAKGIREVFKAHGISGDPQADHALWALEQAVSNLKGKANG